MDILIVTAAVIVVLVVGVMVGWQVMLRVFVQRYYREKYDPQNLKLPEGEVPPEEHLTNVPWITSPLQLCQSTSLQMIAAQNGVNLSRQHFDFLMGFTYGASSMTGTGFMPLGSDPEIGLMTAAPYVGLERRYLTTSDSQRFVQGLRAWIARGYAVRLALDMSTLYEDTPQKFIAHSVVVVGYDPQGFYFYETVAQPPADCEPGERPVGERGQFIATEKLLAAVERMSNEMKYPWRYALSIFEPREVENDLRPVWLANGRAQAEEMKYGPKMGARVIEELAAKLENGGKLYPEEFEPGMELAVKVRADNAQFLRETFPQQVDVLEAAELLEQASKEYKNALKDTQRAQDDKTKAKRAAVRLRQAAEAERKAGEIFIKRGSEGMEA